MTTPDEGDKQFAWYWRWLGAVLQWIFKSDAPNTDDEKEQP
jgi:hypothetical protein